MNFKITKYHSINNVITYQLDSRYFLFNFDVFKKVCLQHKLPAGNYILKYDNKFHLLEYDDWAVEYNKNDSLAILSIEDNGWMSIRSKSRSGYNHITRKLYY